MKKFQFLGLVILSAFKLSAQDARFSQFYANPIYTNPANVGGCFRDKLSSGRVIANYRNHQPGLPGNYKAFNLSADQHMDKLHGGLGIQYSQSCVAYGFLQNQAVNINYAALFNLGEKVQLRAGVQLGYAIRSVNNNKLKFADQIDAMMDVYLIPTNLTTASFSNAATGILITGESFYFGSSLHNVIGAQLVV